MSENTDSDLRGETVYDAAIAAEQATGVREPTEVAARSHLLIRLARIVVGFCVVVAGLGMVVLPGPGVLVVLAGLSILAVDVPFAARLRAELLRRGGSVSARVPRSVAYTLVGAVFAVCVASLLLLR